MSGLAPNSSNYAKTARGVDQVSQLLVHPEYVYWQEEWRKIRDALGGQKEIKRKGEMYLKKMKGMDKDDYEIFLEGATFYNMGAQTVNGMLGQVFRRDPKIRGFPRGSATISAPYDTQVLHFAKDGTSHIGLARTCMSEQITLGRFGILVDSPPERQIQAPSSFAVGYRAEDILDWKIEEINGQFLVTRIVLREFIRYDPFSENNLTPAPDAKLSPTGKVKRVAARPGMPQVLNQSYVVRYEYKAMFRVLSLEFHPDYPYNERVYVQRVHEFSPMTAPISTAVPVVRGVPLDFIPFKFFGATANSPDTESPPLNDIVDLNLSHYRTYANLEYGRTYTALPVYYAPGGRDEGSADYMIGPNTVWEVGVGEAPGILEYTGGGLKTLETALQQKEQQIAAIGGRLMPGNSRSISESNNQTNLREANEQSLLLNAISVCETGMRDITRWWLMFRDVPLEQTASLHYEFDSRFLSAPIGARELRAIQLMYEDGLIPVGVLYEYLSKAEVVPSTMTEEEFKELLADPDSFLNSPDAQARTRGFANRAQELGQVEVHADLAREEREMELEEEKFELAKTVDSTSVVATRKLGDPEGAPATSSDKLAAKTTLSVADKSAQASVKAAAARPAPPKPGIPVAPAKKPPGK